MVAKHFIALNQTFGAATAAVAMHYWYGSDKNFSQLQERYPVSTANDEAVKAQLELMNVWNKEANIQFTPTLYVNDHRLPEAYTVVQLEKLYGYE